MPPPSVDDGTRLGRCLNMCLALEKLDLSTVSLSGKACAAIFNALDAGALPKLIDLNLFDNEIDDEGMSALAEAVERGALPKLREITRMQNDPNAQVGGFNALTSGVNLSDNPGCSHVVRQALSKEP